jgi:hypothetical protein
LQMKLLKARPLRQQPWPSNFFSTI